MRYLFTLCILLPAITSADEAKYVSCMRGVNIVLETLMMQGAKVRGSDPKTFVEAVTKACKKYAK